MGIRKHYSNLQYTRHQHQKLLRVGPCNTCIDLFIESQVVVLSASGLIGRTFHPVKQHKSNL